MASTLTISLSHQDGYDLEKGELKDVSPSKLFRSALMLHRSMGEFLDVYDIIDYRRLARDARDKFISLQKEIARRQEIIDSLRDVLAEKELRERRISTNNEQNNGLRGVSTEIKNRIDRD